MTVGARNFPDSAHFGEIREIIRKFFKDWLSQERDQETFWQMGCRREVDGKLASLGCDVARRATDRITEIHYRRMEALLSIAEDPDHRIWEWARRC